MKHGISQLFNSFFLSFGSSEIMICPEYKQ
jgi:hypothetical protein